MSRPRLESSTWWPQLLEIKDQYTLEELAKRFKCSVNGLSRALKRANVKRTQVRPGSRRAPGKPDPRSAEAQDWWSKFLELKDTHSLAELATRFDVAEITLQRALKRTGTQRVSQRGARGNRIRRDSDVRIEKVKHLLGVLSDGKIARQAGVSRYAVAQFRHGEDIPSVRDQLAIAVSVTTGSLDPRFQSVLDRLSGSVRAFQVTLELCIDGEVGAIEFIVQGTELLQTVKILNMDLEVLLPDTVVESWKLLNIQDTISSMRLSF